jgi:outer membrane protein
MGEGRRWFSRGDRPPTGTRPWAGGLALLFPIAMQTLPAPGPPPPPPRSPAAVAASAPPAGPSPPVVDASAVPGPPPPSDLLPTPAPPPKDVLDTPTDQHGRVLTLADAVSTAARQQPQIRQARAATDAAAARVEEARSAYLPQLTALATFQLTTGNTAPHAGPQTTFTAATPNGTPVIITPTAPTPITAPYGAFNFQLNATQLIYDFGATWEKYKASKASVEALRATEQVTGNQIVENVRTAFFQARAQKALVKVAEETLANEQKHLLQIQGFVAVGTHPVIDLAQARTDLANARVALISAQNAYMTSKAQLNQAMGLVGGALDYEVADDSLPPVEGEEEPIDQLGQQALKARPELLSFQKQREAQELTIKSIKGTYLPSISATGQAAESGIATAPAGAALNWWYAGVAVNWPFYQGGLTKGQVREQEAILRGIDAQTDVEKLQVRLDVEQARLSIRAYKNTIAATKDALTNSRDLLRLAEGRYATGVGGVIELGDAQVAYSNAEAQVVQAEYNLAVARTQLLAALGGR